MEFLEQAVFWHWMLFGLALAILEMLAPGVVFLWLGLAAILTGVALWIAPVLGWTGQVITFALLSLVCTIAGRMAWKRLGKATDHPTLNRRGRRYEGRVLTLHEPIVNGLGKVRVDDTTWKVAGPDLPAGTRVRVSGADGAVLNVEPVAN